jgi:hypothetical protein
LERNVCEGVVSVNILATGDQESKGVNEEHSSQALVTDENSIFTCERNVGDGSLAVLGRGVGDQVEGTDGRGDDWAGRGR